ncbi:hypothetical protein COBT_004271, partial [Conglomerata obtusa]
KLLFTQMQKCDVFLKELLQSDVFRYLKVNLDDADIIQDIYNKNDILNDKSTDHITNNQHKSDVETITVDLLKYKETYTGYKEGAAHIWFKIHELVQENPDLKDIL